MNSFWAQRNPRERVLILLCLIVVVVGGWMIWAPVSTGDKKLPPFAQAHQDYEKTLKQKFAFEEETDRLKPQIEKAVYTEAPEQLIPQTIRKLQGFAKDSDLHLREIKPLRMRRTAEVIKVPLSVRFTTQFDKSIPFLYRIEDPKVKMIVEKVNITSTDPKSRTVDVEVQVALFTRGGAVESI